MMKKIKLGNVSLYIDENTAKQHYPHLLYLSQDSTETQETDLEKLSTDNQTKALTDSSEDRGQTSLRKSRRKAGSDKEALNEQQ